MAHTFWCSFVTGDGSDFVGAFLTVAETASDAISRAHAAGIPRGCEAAVIDADGVDLPYDLDRVLTKDELAAAGEKRVGDYPVEYQESIAACVVTVCADCDGTEAPC